MLRKTLSALFCSALLACPALAQEYHVGELYIDHPWARALPPVAPAGAAYLRIENRGDLSEKLVAAHTPVARKVEVHENIHADGLMKMQKIEELSITPGASVTFEPGGYHFMMFGLKQPLLAGERFPLTLVFENAGSIEMEVTIKEEPAERHHH